ncbi:PREDICTED: uncharacterized protein LOC108378059, partial [Rhagoletis zephyria]|uniref:uncharacterized protein LOC108378059 n=1 Tax=Rhagoletis zephyria TaxID=28612 RepID=UPI0008117825
MLSHSDEYGLLRKLETLGETVLDRTDRLKCIRKPILENISKAFENSAKRYNLRSNAKNFQTGDTVNRRNFVLSDASRKFAPKFLKAKVITVKGNSMYELEDKITRKRGIYHRKDIQEAKG